MHRTLQAPVKAAAESDVGRSLNALVELTGAERVAIAITDRNDNLVLEATPAFSEIHQVDHTILMDALAGRRELDVDGTRLLLSFAPIGDGRVAAVLAVPDDAETARRFSRWSDLVLADVSRSLFTERDRRRSLEMQRLNATAQRVAATLDPEAVLTEIVRDATALLGADGGDIVLKDKERPVLRVVAVADIPATMMGFEMDLGEGLTSYAMKTGRPVMETDYRHSKRRARQLDVYGFKSVLCAPLISRGEAIGAINVHNTKEHRRFTQEEIELLTAFAGYAAVAIDNARRYQRESAMAADLAEVNEALARSLSLQQRLVGRVLADEGPQAIAQELADLLRVPVVLQDDGLRVVAGAAPDSTDWRSLGVPRSMLGEPEFARFLDGLLQTSHATGMEFESAEAGASWRIVPVRAGPRDVHGYLILPTQEPALTPLDQALIEVATTAVALEFSKRRARVDVEQKLRGDVVMDLLTGSYDSEDAIIARAARLGFDLSIPRDVIALRVDGLDTPESVRDHSREIALRRRVFDTIYESVAARSAESMIAAHGQAVIVLAAQCDIGQGGYGGLEPDDLVSELRRLVVPMLPRDAAVGAAIGSRCAATPDYQVSFRLTQITLDALRRLNLKGGTLATEDLGVFRFVISSSSREEVVSFARQRLAPLLESGDYGRNLLTTLRLYIAAGFNQREAARRGFAHPNTIGYRLRRVEDLLSVSLSDPQALVDLAFAVKLADLVGL